MSQIKTKQELLEEIEKFQPIFNAIENISYRVLDDEKDKKQFFSMQKNLAKWSKKLKNPKFEVAIIGTEKAGKSTFANVLLKNNYLPEAKGRCTFTTTTIESSDDKNQAIVKFFTNDEFMQKFQALCEEIELFNFDYESATLAQLEDFLADKSSAVATSNAVDDIKAILETRTNIKQYLDLPDKIITTDLKNSVKEYIIDEEKARAVKSITIESTELKDMKDLIIYDVPGFDSPTNIHLEQAKKYMVEADVVIMLVSIADRISFVKAQSDFLNDTKDEYGASLADKMIVVASKFDKHILSTKEESEQEVAEYMEILNEQLKKFNLYKKENILQCSSLAYLEKYKIVSGDKATSKLSSVGIDDGIETFNRRLQEFFEKDALKVLNDVVSNDIKAMEIFLTNFKLKHSIGNSEEKVEKDLYKIKKEFKLKVNKKLIDLVIEKKKFIDSQNDFNINQELEDEINTNWIEKLKLSDDDRIEYAKPLSTEGGIERVDKLNDVIREDLYKKSLLLVSELVSSVVVEKDLNVIQKFREDIVKIFDIKDDILLEKLNDTLDAIMLQHAYNEKSYKPLMTRFINDIFKLLILNPLTTNANGQRIKAFKKVSLNIESLFPFDTENYEDELEFGVYEKTLVKQILAQYEPLSLDVIMQKLNSYKSYFIENINMESLSKELKNSNISLKRLSIVMEEQKTNFKNKTKDVVIKTIQASKPKNSIEALLDHAEEATTYKEVQIEINKDLEILKNIISDVLLKAMMIEKPFIDSLLTQVEAIRIDINDINIFDEFIELNIKKLDKANYNNISGDEELNNKILNIISQIENV